MNGIVFKYMVALNLAVCFTRAGYRTLAVDLDQQGNLSAALGANLNELKLTAHRLLIDDQAEISAFLLEPRSRLRLLPNTIDVEADALVEAKRVNRELPLRRRSLSESAAGCAVIEVFLTPQLPIDAAGMDRHAEALSNGWKG